MRGFAAETDVFGVVCCTRRSADSIARRTKRTQNMFLHRGRAPVPTDTFKVVAEFVRIPQEKTMPNRPDRCHGLPMRGFHLSGFTHMMQGSRAGRPCSFSRFALRLFAFVLYGAVLLCVARFLRNVLTFFDTKKNGPGEKVPIEDSGEFVVGERARMENLVVVRVRGIRTAYLISVRARVALGVGQHKISF